MNACRVTAYLAGQLAAASGRVGEQAGTTTDDIKVLP